MDKTRYHKLLEAVRDKILGESFASVIAGIPRMNVPSTASMDEYLAACRTLPDPSRWKRLEEICSNPKVKERLELLTKLYALESKIEKTSFDVWLAMLWSGQARIRSPLWAVRKFEAIGDGRLFDDDVQSLDKAFGFRDGRGKTSELLNRAKHVQYDALCREVWGLTLLNLKVTPACRMVARRFQQEHRSTGIHELRDIGEGRSGSFAEHLRQLYYPWRKANEHCFIRMAKPSWVAWLATHGDEFLKRFPSE